MERSGRPRDPLIDDAVLDATLETLTAVGYARLTVEAVARRARTTKPSVYRRWPSRQALVTTALVRRLGAPPPPVPDTGCVVCDLVAGVGVFVAAFRRLPPGVLSSLLADCAEHPALRKECMTELFEPPRQLVRAVVARAQRRGDLRADLDRALAVDLLGALVHYRALFGHAPTDHDAVEASVTTLLRGMAADQADLAARWAHHSTDRRHTIDKLV